MKKKILILSLFIFLSFGLNADNNKIIIASTTSTYDTGLLTYLNNAFKEKYNIEVQVLSQGTGQAIRSAMDGNIEVLLVHHKQTEENFLLNNYGIKRYDLMYNDYVIVGPITDEKKCSNIGHKLKEINKSNELFISRGDDSGTHKKELELWKSIELKVNNFNKNNYLKVGQGMGNTLLIANEKKGYTISDRGTWISFNKKNNLKIICENQPPLFNQYGLILINPDINKNLNFKYAKQYVEWLISSEGKKLINSFKKNGQQLFFTIMNNKKIAVKYMHY